MNDPRLIDELLEGFPELATPQEVGDLLRLGIVTINKWLRSGQLPVIRAGRRVNRIPKKELREFLLNADTLIDPEHEERAASGTKGSEKKRKTRSRANDAENAESFEDSTNVDEPSTQESTES